jgi:hypothetical protein
MPTSNMVKTMKRYLAAYLALGLLASPALAADGSSNMSNRPTSGPQGGWSTGGAVDTMAPNSMAGVLSTGPSSCGGGCTIGSNGKPGGMAGSI